MRFSMDVIKQLDLICQSKAHVGNMFHGCSEVHLWSMVVACCTFSTPMCKTNLWKHRHTDNCVQICTNVYRRVQATCWAISDRTDMKMILYKVVSRVELDGDVRFFLAPPK